MKKRVLFVYGTRPEAVKMAPVVRAAQQTDRLDVQVCLTGQHREMLAQVNDFFQVQADYDLGAMSPGQDLAEVSARILKGLSQILKAQRPDLVFVQGDTTSTFMGALAAFYAQIPVAHIEAGLRTGHLNSPFPEEGNRQLTTRLAALHFAPTAANRDNLLREGIDANKIHITGNSGIDALLLAVENLRQQPMSLAPLGRAEAILKERLPYVLVTGHRRESFGVGFEEICHALRDLAVAYPKWQFIYPVHLNPQVQEPVRRLLAEVPNICLIEPQGYPLFVTLMDQAHLILTDSGGVQEEAPSLGKPVLVMRETTERPEAVEAGTVALVGSNRQRIVEGVTALIKDQSLYEKMTRVHNPYGDGRSSERIVQVIKELFD